MSEGKNFLDRSHFEPDAEAVRQLDQQVVQALKQGNNLQDEVVVGLIAEREKLANKFHALLFGAIESAGDSLPDDDADALIEEFQDVSAKPDYPKLVKSTSPSVSAVSQIDTGIEAQAECA